MFFKCVENNEYDYIYDGNTDFSNEIFNNRKENFKAACRAESLWEASILFSLLNEKLRLRSYKIEEATEEEYINWLESQ